MIVLDSDHLRELRGMDAKAGRLQARLLAAGDPDVATTVVAVAEGVSGWLAEVNRARTPEAAIAPYAAITDLVDYFSEWEVLPFDQAAAAEFTRLKAIREIRNIKTTDLRIAAFVRSRSQPSLLLSADGHFRTIAQHTTLRVEDWRSYDYALVDGSLPCGWRAAHR